LRAQKYLGYFKIMFLISIAINKKQQGSVYQLYFILEDLYKNAQLFYIGKSTIS